jgi:hypothetical protein
MLLAGSACIGDENFQEDTMTPGELYNDYRDLHVDLLEGRFLMGIDVHEYRNHSLDGEFSTAHGVEAYSELVKKIQKHCKKIGQGKYRFVHAESTLKNGYVLTYAKVDVITTWPDLMRPYIGKGTPDDIRMVLRLAVHYDLLTPTISEVQKYCDRNIGIDCSGFASAYYGGQWMGKGASYYRDNAVKLTKLEDVRPGDAIVWQNGVHIAVIDRITSEEKTSGIIYSLGCSVAESTGDRMVTDGPSDGLNYTEYYLLFDGPGKFKAMRSLVKKNEDSFYSPKVYVMHIS